MELWVFQSLAARRTSLMTEDHGHDLPLELARQHTIVIASFAEGIGDGFHGMLGTSSGPQKDPFNAGIRRDPVLGKFSMCGPVARDECESPFRSVPVSLASRPVTADYLSRCRALIDRVSEQTPLIQETARLFAGTILAGRMVHLLDPDTAGSWWRKCGPGTVPFRVQSHRRTVAELFTTSSWAPTDSARRCFWRT